MSAETRSGCKNIYITAERKAKLKTLASIANKSESMIIGTLIDAAFKKTEKGATKHEGS